MHQTCLAHLARDLAYAVEVSDDPVPWRLQLWLQSAVEVGQIGGRNCAGDAELRAEIARKAAESRWKK